MGRDDAATKCRAAANALAAARTTWVVSRFRAEKMAFQFTNHDISYINDTFLTFFISNINIKTFAAIAKVVKIDSIDVGNNKD